MEEYPIAVIPGTAHWSENFAFAGFDPKSGIGLFCHIGRWRRDLTLWREVVMVALPDGTVAGHRGIGNARAAPQAAGGSNYKLEIVEPGRRFRLDFLGGAERVPAATLLHTRLGGGPQHRLAFDLAYEGVTPVWDISAVGDKSEFMGAGHVEQIGRLAGTIECDGERYAFDSLVNRDHSRGYRVFDSNKRHIWMQAYFEDGLMVQLYEAEVTGREGPAYSEVNVVENGVSHRGTVIVHDKLPFTDNRPLIDAPVRLTVSYAGNRLDFTATGFVHTMHCQSTSPNDMYIGCRQQDEVQNTTVLEQTARYVAADGRNGFGHMERLVPGKLLVDPA